MTNLEWAEKPIEGDYLETNEGLLFAVKGLEHPKSLVIAYLRYIPDSKGNRVRDGRHYSRVYRISETTDYLLDNYPKYLNNVDSMGLVLQSVPLGNIYRLYKPREYLQRIIKSQGTPLEEACIQFVNEISNRSNVDLKHFGVSGSPLIGLDTPSSDIDLNVYGEAEGKEVHKILDSMRAELDWISPYNSKTVNSVLGSRWRETRLNLNYFKEIEIKKQLHGRVSGRDYFIRLIKPIETDELSRPLGFVKIRGVIEEAESLFTPCCYQFRLIEYIEPAFGPDITKLVSFRGRFTEQAQIGSVVEVYGSIEKVTSKGFYYYRVILGSPRDYLLPVNILDR